MHTPASVPPPGSAVQALARAPAKRALSPRRINWYLAMPKIAIAAILALVGGLLWIYQQSEQEEQRESLIADILWLEQNLRFQINDDSSVIEQIGSELMQEPDPVRLFSLRAAHVLRTRPEIVQLRWTNAAGDTRSVSPHLPTRRDELAAFGPLQPTLAQDMSRRLGKPAFAPPFLLADGEARFDAWIPIFDKGNYTGALVATYSLPILLDRQVPWWFAERYFVQIVDDAGLTLARKSNVTGHPTNVYSLALDPPGHGLLLQAVAYRQGGNTALRVLAGAIVFLALIVFWSLLALRGHIKRRLAVEQALRQANAFREAMENSLFTGLRARDLDGKITYVNPAFCRMTGYSPEELIGHPPPMPYWAEEEMERTLAMHHAVLEGNAPGEGFEIRLKRKDGVRFDALIFEAPLIDGDGQHVGWMGSVMDITDRNRARDLVEQQQARLQHTARLVSMGEMASTLAHELNQPLSAITSYTSGCLNKLESGQYTPEELAGALRKMAAQGQRAGRIIRQVHDFVRKREPRREPCAIAEIIDDNVALFEAEARKRGVRILRRFQGGMPEVLADPHMLGQVLLNLMRNGVEAMQDQPSNRRTLEISAHRQDNQVVVAIADHGHGIDPATAEKLFTPFFTTKDEGMGMGLSICRSIIEFHHGHLWLDANPDGGTIFQFSLPAEAA